MGLRGAGAGALGVLVVVCPLVLVVLLGRPVPVERLDQHGGAVWVASPEQGLVSLVDGASEQVVVSVPVPGAVPGDELEVVQAGSSAYLTHPASGAVLRVDGATYEVGAPRAVAEPGTGAQVLTNGEEVFAVDPVRHTATPLDRRTLTPGRPVSLTVEAGAGRAVVDAGGDLWVVDAAGSLSWVRGDTKRVLTGDADVQSRLVVVQGRVVLVDVAGGRAGPVGEDGRVTGWSCLDVRAGDAVQLLGSSEEDAVHAAVPSSGTLVTTRLGGSGCGDPVRLGEPGTADFGPLAQSGRFVFVPDRATGVTSVVDTARRERVAELVLGEPGHRVELIAEDGLVFYNDLDSHAAGVLTLADGTWEVGDAVEKYSPATEQGTRLLASGPGDALPVPQVPAGGAVDGAWAELAPVDRSRQAAGAPRTDTTAEGPVIRGVTVRPLPLVLGEPATFVADVTGSATSWRWTLTGADGEQVARAATRGRFTATPEPGHGETYTLTLVVTDAQGRTARLSQDLDAVPEPVPHIESFAIDDPTPAIDQVVRLAAVETGLGDAPGAVWEWTVEHEGAVGAFDPPPPPGAPVSLAGPVPGVYTLGLTITFEGREASASVEITVADRCAPILDAQRTVDLRADGRATLRVALADCYTARAVRVEAPGWLSAPAAVEVPARGPVAADDGTPVNPPGQVVEVPVELVGVPPSDGTQAGALALRLDDGEPVRVDVRVNVPPAWTGEPTCTPGTADSAGRVRLSAGLADADLGALDVQARITGPDGQPVERRMPRDPSEPGRFSVLVPATDVAGSPGWSVTARDLHGAAAPELQVVPGCW